MVKKNDGNEDDQLGGFLVTKAIGSFIELGLSYREIIYEISLPALLVLREGMILRQDASVEREEFGSRPQSSRGSRIDDDAGFTEMGNNLDFMKKTVARSGKILIRQ